MEALGCENWQVPWMILNFLGKGVERILKVSRKNLHLKICFLFKFLDAL